MGREIKRVALDFDYPINQMIWKGYYNPFRGLECKCCDGKGTSKEFQAIKDDWYGFDRPENKWCYSITQDEVQALLDADRLWDFTRVPLNEKQHEDVKRKVAEGGNSWLSYDNGKVPTAKEVNEWAKVGFGHDSINAYICAEARAKRFGITDLNCPVCHGEGVLWPDEKYKKLSEDFEWIDPPSGEGYQLWSTTTEGTPMSPVFDTPEKLAKWLYENKVSSFGYQTCDYETWLSFIKNSSYAPSMVGTSKGLQSGVEATTSLSLQE